MRRMEEKSLTEKLYYHWSFMICASWGVIGLLVIPMWIIARPTNYDFMIVMGMIISYAITTTYVYIIDEAESSRSYSDGLKRIFENKNLSSKELGERVNMYRKMF